MTARGLLRILRCGSHGGFASRIVDEVNHEVKTWRKSTLISLESSAAPEAGGQTEHSDVTRTPSTIHSLLFNPWLAHFVIWGTFGLWEFAAQLFVSFVSVHQADVTPSRLLKLFPYT